MSRFSSFQLARPLPAAMSVFPCAQLSTRMEFLVGTGVTPEPIPLASPRSGRPPAVGRLLRHQRPQAHQRCRPHGPSPRSRRDRRFGGRSPAPDRTWRDTTNRTCTGKPAQRRSMVDSLNHSLRRSARRRPRTRQVWHDFRSCFASDYGGGSASMSYPHETMHPFRRLTLAGHP